MKQLYYKNLLEHTLLHLLSSLLNEWSKSKFLVHLEKAKQNIPLEY